MHTYDDRIYHEFYVRDVIMKVKNTKEENTNLLDDDLPF